MVFADQPRYYSERGYGDLTFQADTHQINWYQWTDSLDLSPAGCRAAGLLPTRPDDPRRVENVEFTAKDTSAATPYVTVKAWVVRA